MGSESNGQPRVSLGVPVYNAQAYVRQTMDSLLAQTFTDFELVISDNGSTDATGDICREYAARDSRVKYHRADQNRGPAWNFNRVVELSCGKYFKWNAADDECAPTFLEKCVQVLDADESVAVAFPLTSIIDEKSQKIRDNNYDIHADVNDPVARFWRVMCINHRLHGAHELYGLIRRDLLLKTPVYEQYVRADSVLLARLALLGRFRCVPEYLFLNREHQTRSVRMIPGKRSQQRSRLSRWIGVGPVPPAEWWNASLKGKIVFPEWTVLRQYARSAQFADLSTGQRMSFWMTMGIFTLRHTPKLLRDVLIACEHLLFPPKSPAKPNDPEKPVAAVTR